MGCLNARSSQATSTEARPQKGGSASFERNTRSNQINAIPTVVSPARNERRSIETTLTKEQRDQLANHYKENGNTFFRSKDYTSALKEYSQALVYREDVILYTNRALCYKFLKEWIAVQTESQEALRIDQNNFKARRLYGISLLKKWSREPRQGVFEIEKGISILENLITESTNEDIILGLKHFVIQGKKLLWTSSKESLSIRVGEAEKYLGQLMEKMEDHQAVNLSEFSNLMLQRIDDEFKIRENPEFLCCKISFELFEDPMLTPYGPSYDKKMILDHLKKQERDPITRNELQPAWLIRNKTIKQAVDDYVHKNPWSYEGVDDES